MVNDDLYAGILRAGARLGYTAIRPNQHKAVKSFIEGNDVFISLPTGSGKSFCCSVLPFVFDGLYQRIVIVVSPLIALMKGQVRMQLSLMCGESNTDLLATQCLYTVFLQLQIGHKIFVDNSFMSLTPSA